MSQAMLVPRTLRFLDRHAERNSIVRRGQIIAANLGNVTGEQPDMDYETAAWYVAQALAVHQGHCQTEMHKRIRSRMDEHTLSYCATGRA